MKNLLFALLFVCSSAFAQTTYVLPNPEVAVGLSFYGNPASFSGPKVSITVSDPAYTGGNPIKGPVTQKEVFVQGPWGPYFYGYEFSGTFTTPLGQTAVYSQVWERLCSGGRDYTCHFLAAGGSLSVQ